MSSDREWDTTQGGQPSDVPGGHPARLHVETKTYLLTEEQVQDLVFLAERALYLQDTEFSNKPTEEDKSLMLSIYRLIGKEIPEYSARRYGWKLDPQELNSDGVSGPGPP